MSLRAFLNKLFFRKHTPGKIVASSGNKVFKKLTGGEVVTPPPHVHEYDSNWKSDAYTHWRECSCGYSRTDTADHADTDGDGKCDACGYILPVAPPGHTHEYGASWWRDAYSHWHECSCGSRRNSANHADNNGDGKCDVCGYTMPVTPTPTPPKPSRPPIGIEADNFNLKLLRLNPGTYLLRATVSAMSLQLAESDLSEPIEYVVK